jgi:hypothetical protein
VSSGALQDELHGAPVRTAPPGPAPDSPVFDMGDHEYHLVADRTRAILRIPEVGAFTIDAGRSVAVDPDPDAEPGMVSAYLNSSVASLLLAQRGSFALHANAVGIDGGAVLIAGHSGSGKSTTALRLLQRGHAHLADDMCLLMPRGADMELQPNNRGLKVTDEEAAALEADRGRPVRPFASSRKLVLPTTPGAPTRVRAITILEPVDEPGLSVRHVRGAEAVSEVLAHVYRADFLLPIWPDEVFAWAAATSHAVPVHVINRPWEGLAVDTIAAAVESCGRRG